MDLCFFLIYVFSCFFTLCLKKKQQKNALGFRVFSITKLPRATEQRIPFQLLVVHWALDRDRPTATNLHSIG